MRVPSSLPSFWFRRWHLVWLCLLALAPRSTGAPPYEERYRPRYHFTSERGYINDPNGLFFRDGTYHLFFQRDGIREKKWGHATSADCLYWTQHKNAIVPAGGHPVFSGSAAVDKLNTTGFGTADNPPVVACFTEWGLGQSLAYSTDQGKTWKRYEGNPVLKRPSDAKRSFPLSSRDPHIMWDEVRRRWVMVLYDNPDQTSFPKSDPRHRQGFSIFTSPDLKQWIYRSHLPDFYVCPDLIKLPVEGTDETRWVAMDWERYTVGDFDGEVFTPQQPIVPLDHGAPQALSANQSWKHLPDGRTIQICWLRGGKYPGMPFDQQMSIPAELTLRKIGDTIRLCRNPIRELRKLYGDTRSLPATVLAKDRNLSLKLPTQSYDLHLNLNLDPSESLTLNALGTTVVLERSKITALDCTATVPEPLTHLRLLADITSIELFANHGAAGMTFHLLPPDEPQGVTLSARKGSPRILKAELHSVKSIWK